MTNSQSTLNNVMFDASEFYRMYYESDDEDEDMFEDLFDDDELKDITAPHYRSTNAYYTHEDRLNSHIYKTYLSPEAVAKGVRDRSTYLGKKFRQKFRTPYNIFLQIVVDIRANGYNENKLVTGKPKIPLQLLVLACLRCISSGCTYDMIEDLSAINAEILRKFFHIHFCCWGVRKAPFVISMPTS